MPAYKDKVTNKWFAQFYCKNWQGDKILENVESHTAPLGFVILEIL